MDPRGSARLVGQPQVIPEPVLDVQSVLGDQGAQAHRAVDEPGYLDSLLPPASAALGPRARVLAVFDRVEAIAAEPGCRGCPYVSVASEVKVQEHPARVVARRFHDTLTAYFRAAVAEAGVADA